MDYAAMPAEDVAFACFNGGDESAWREFIRRFNPMIASVALRVARKWEDSSPQVIEDLIQETYLKLCADRSSILARFKADHPDAIYGFIKVFTANLVQDHFKMSRAQKRGGLSDTSSLDANPPEGREIQSRPNIASLERKLLLEQVATLLSALAAGPNAERDRRIFWLYYRTGLSASAIAALPTIGLSTKGVESTILRLTRAVRQKLDPRSLTPPTARKPIEGIRSPESF